MLNPYKKCKSEPRHAQIKALNDDGKGVARVDGKVTFIDGALPGEEVSYCLEKKRKSYDRGWTIEIIKPSPDRIEPPCEYFGLCGGCSLQHLNPEIQIKEKQNILRDKFYQFGKIDPDSWLPPLSGPLWNYRRSARLGVRYVEKKGGVLIGFREKGSAYITSLKKCRVLDERLSVLLPDLHDLIASLSCYNRIPQIETIGSDDEVSLVFRHLEPFTEKDHSQLIEFGKKHTLRIYLQSKGPETVSLFYPQQAESLSYSLPDYNIIIAFKPTNFIQVNASINQKMIKQAIELLEANTDDTVLDLFCGLGNFTLPLASVAGRVIGIEADYGLIAAAANNAELNRLKNVSFQQADLYQEDLSLFDDLPEFNKLLLDPPRSGALEVIKQLAKTSLPQKIVYVSCNPATLARDAEYLLKEYNYQLIKAGVMDMFPQTNHVESIAVFELK